MEPKRRKLHTSGGFTFAELMLTMLILALMTGMAAQGIPVVIHTYQRAVDTANAETYLNTTMIALRSRLCVSKPVLKANGAIDYFEHPQTGYYNIRNNEDDGIQIVQYLDIDRTRESYQPLAPSEKLRRQNDLILTSFVSSYDTINYPQNNGDFFTISGLKVEKVDKDGSRVVLATLEDDDYVIHTLNP
ncbi:MAG: prepilin-type N-terminal cleavage/methylation domain-containing protein [Oscillospiraceae bacterium]|nr:prepilin-type N-terminal cleavage/methylation domain-containing protein [Oscillospiraceae bacterium]